jgi:hypothetical protein
MICMTKTLVEQEAHAEALFREAFARHPRSARTTVLWCKWRDLKARLLVHRATVVSSSPIGHLEPEIVSPA